MAEGSSRSEPGSDSGDGGLGKIVAELRGECKICKQNVTTLHERVRDDTGSYFHAACVQSKVILFIETLVGCRRGD